jgi:hypothetical protein
MGRRTSSFNIVIRRASQSQVGDPPRKFPTPSSPTSPDIKEAKRNEAKIVEEAHQALVTRSIRSSASDAIKSLFGIDKHSKRKNA